MSSAFTEEEILKLKSYTAPNRAVGNKQLNRADPQDAHRGVAVNALVQLYRAHDHSMVNYGHYALIEDEKTTFYRHLIRSFGFTEPNGKEPWTAFNFTEKVYDKSAYPHLEKNSERLSAAI